MDPRGEISKYDGGKELVAVLDKHLARDPDAQKDIASCVIRIISECKGSDPSKGPAQVRIDKANALCTVPDVNFVNPRGKFNLLVCAEALVLSSAKSEIVIPVSAIKAVAILDNIPKDTKGKVLMFLSLDKDAGVMSGKQKLDAVVLQTTADAQLSLATSQGQQLEGPAAVVLCQLLGLVDVSNFFSPDTDLYQSSKGDQAIGAFVKVSNGWLYPMPAALCFVERPAMLLLHEDIRHVELCRASGSSSTFDLAVHLKGGGMMQFDQIDRQELVRLHSYIAACKIKTSLEQAQAAEARAAGGSGSGGMQEARPTSRAQEEEAEDEDEDEEEDSDFDPEAAESEEEDRRPTKRKREAGRTDGAGPSNASTSQADEDDDEAEDEDEEDEDEEDEDEDEDEDEIELCDEEGISAARVTELMQDDRGGRGKRGGAAGSSRAGGSGSRAGGSGAGSSKAAAMDADDADDGEEDSD